MRYGSSAAAIAIALLTAVHAKAESPAAFCQRVGTDDTARPIPETLVPTVNAAFGTRMPTRVATNTTVFRCADRRVLVCTVGANLPCGKANTSRMPGEGAVRWCADHADSAFVPAVATGHDTIYEWRCTGGTPQIARQVLEVDARGFVAEFWKSLP
jgi:hypothetical protein